jgi:hypothetical protein
VRVDSYASDVEWLINNIRPRSPLSKHQSISTFDMRSAHAIAVIGVEQEKWSIFITGRRSIIQRPVVSKAQIRAAPSS